jgi:hypothetical protein
MTTERSSPGAAGDFRAGDGDGPAGGRDGLSPDAPVLALLMRWYADQCDGLWEHGYGVRIDTLDNPGWCIRIETRGTATPLADFGWQKAGADTNTDWMHHCVEEGTFRGYGDPSKLEPLLRLFLALVGRGRH